MSENTLRDALSTALHAQEAAQTDEVASNTPAETVITVPAETEQQKEDRLRDEAGRFKAGEKTETKVDVKPVVKSAEQQVQPPEVVTRKPPSSWKKDYWEAYQKLDPKVAQYIDQREQQFASGVSTYRQEAERAKELFDAIAPFQQDLQQHGVQPSQWIRQLGTAHQVLVRGSPEQKLQVFRQLAHDYGVTLEGIQSGQPDQVMQYLSPLQEQVRQLQGQLTGWQQQQQLQEQAQIQSEIDAFSAQNEHFEAVKETMAGLLQAGLAQDLKSAYEKAIRMDDNVWQAAQQQQSETAEKQRREAEAARVAKARANVTSTRSATPAGTMTNGKKDVRSLLTESVTQMLGSARV